MRFTIAKEPFLKSLNAAGHAIAPKNPIATLANVKLDLNDHGLEVTGSNSEITIRSIVPFAIEGKEIIRSMVPGAILVNARILTEAVRRMDGAEVTVEIIDDSVAKVDDGKSSFKLNCMKAGEYPDIDLSPDGTLLELRCADFASLVDQSAFAASTKEQRPVLTALNLEAGDGTLVATATDAARLARKSISVDSDARFRCNVPSRVVMDIVRLFEGAETVTLSVSDSKILFRFDNNTVSSRLIAGDYPVTKAIIPQNFNYYLEVNGQELLRAMERVSILSVDREPVVKISMREDEVEVSAKNESSGSANEHISTFQYTGERLEVSFNSIYVMDAIKALKAEDVTICFIAEMKPFVVRNPKDDSVVELITPMRTY